MFYCPLGRGCPCATPASAAFCCAERICCATCARTAQLSILRLHGAAALLLLLFSVRFCSRGAQEFFALRRSNKLTLRVMHLRKPASLTSPALWLAPWHTVEGRMDDSWMVGAAVIMSAAAADVDGTAACRATASAPGAEGPAPALDCCALATSSVKLMICSHAHSPRQQTVITGSPCAAPVTAA